MQYDIMLAERLMERDGPATVRVYGWKPWAISLGYHQSDDEIDRALAEASGVDVVRRPTGGRAILHAEEITYSVTMRTTESLPATYERINRALVRAVRFLGVQASLETHQPDFSSHYREAASTMCFSSSARNEVKVDGRKLIGSAQRRFQARDGAVVVLQHGSLLLGHAHRAIVDYLRSATTVEREQLRDLLWKKTTDLREILGRDVSFLEAASALRKAFEMEWNISFIDGEPVSQPVPVSLETS